MKIIEKKGNLVLVLASKGERVQVRNPLHLDISQYLEHQEIFHNGDEFLIFSNPIYLLLRDYDRATRKCTSIFFARMVIKDITPCIGEVAIRRKYQAALLHAKVVPLYAPPRFKTVILYPSLEEIGVGNYSEVGDSGWITTERVVRQCLKNLPDIQDSGIEANVFIITHKGLNSRFIHSKETPPYDIESTEQVVRVSYDQGSLKVKQITDMLHGSKEIPFVMYLTSAKNRYLNIGTRIPTIMRPCHLAMD